MAPRAGGLAPEARTQRPPHFEVSMQVSATPTPLPLEVLMSLFGARATRVEVGESDASHEPEIRGDEGSINSRSAAAWRTISMADVATRRTCGHVTAELTSDRAGRIICERCRAPLAERTR